MPLLTKEGHMIEGTKKLKVSVNLPIKYLTLDEQQFIQSGSGKVVIPIFKKILIKYFNSNVLYLLNLVQDYSNSDSKILKENFKSRNSKIDICLKY